jgi:hypothetical protein
LSWWRRATGGLALVLVTLTGCLGAKKFVGPGEGCYRDAFLAGDVECEDGSVCLIAHTPFEWGGVSSGVCWPSCSMDADCAAGQVCANRLCAVPCTTSGGCEARQECCELGKGRGCLPAPTCHTRGTPIAPAPDGGAAPLDGRAGEDTR